MVTTADVIPYIGAAAWLPHVVTWIHKAATRPVLTVLPDKQAELGFTTFGPILNVQLALAAARKDVVLTRLAIKVVHENGEAHDFSWRGMTETVSSLKDNLGVQHGVFEKTHPAIAMKITTTGLVVHQVRFHEDRFKKLVTPFDEAATKHLEYLRSKDGAYHDEFLNSEKLADLINACKENFWWQVGKYRLTFEAQSTQRLRLPRNVFTFSLKKADVDLLRDNLAVLRESYEVNVKSLVPGFDKQSPRWNWRYPPIDKE